MHYRLNQLVLEPPIGLPSQDVFCQEIAISNAQALRNLDIPKRGMPVTIITGFLGSGKTTLLNHRPPA